MDMKLEEWLEYIKQAEQELSPWQEYFAKIILDEQVYARLESTPFIKNIADDAKGKDLIDFILFTLYFQIPITCSERNNYIVQKERALEKEQIKQRMLESISFINDHSYIIFDDLIGVLDLDPIDYKLPKEEPAWFQKREYIRLLLADTKRNLDTLLHLIAKINSTHEANPKNHNYLLSRKFSFPIGVRNICLRYTVLCTQIAGLYQANRQFYTFAYEILKLLPFHILGDTLLDTIDIDSIPKYIKDIDISNPNQKYYTAFLGFSELDEHGLILPKIQAWAKRGLSFKAYLEFRNRWEANSPISWGYG